ncbi:apolipoprotein L3-like isoform X2 [Chiloscyllium plagiosum]|uniref:apolipoprotein L3-like isoform X2 n=2 Tax=Chiloscyllium plagiosum TaxID=36176 RepID=UPI001CB84499|nr:apolipoprotein L3-like isoform X2 [Chiloscyllium plagiosum]
MIPDSSSDTEMSKKVTEDNPLNGNVNVKDFLLKFDKHIPQMITYSKELRDIANCVDTCKRDVNIANVTGTSASIVGGLLAIAGLIASPFTFGASLVLTGVGLGVGAAGGVTNIGASITDHVIQKKKTDKMKEIIELFEKYNKIMLESLCWVQQSIEVSIRMREETISRSSAIGATQALTKSLNPVLVVTSNVTRNALRAAKAVSGVLSGLLLVWDMYHLVKDAKDLHEGSKTELAQEIRKAADDVDETIEEYRKVYQEIVESAQFLK